MHIPVIDDFGGAPIADHDYACPVCGLRKAVLHLNTGVFHPCDACARQGWRLRKKSRFFGR